MNTPLRFVHSYQQTSILNGLNGTVRIHTQLFLHWHCPSFSCNRVYCGQCAWSRVFILGPFYANLNWLIPKKPFIYELMYFKISYHYRPRTYYKGRYCFHSCLSFSIPWFTSTISRKAALLLPVRRIKCKGLVRKENPQAGLGRDILPATVHWRIQGSGTGKRATPLHQNIFILTHFRK